MRGPPVRQVKPKRKLSSPTKPGIGTFAQAALVSSPVVVKLARGASLSRESVEGIVHLVGYAVPDLKPENVTVVDEAGRVLNRLGLDAVLADMRARGERV